MSRLLLLLLLIAPGAYAESYLYMGLGAGKNTVLFNNSTVFWEDQDGMGNKFSIGYRNRFARSWNFYADYSHYSQLFEGMPRNNKPETSSDHFMLGIEYIFWSKP